MLLLYFLFIAMAVFGPDDGKRITQNPTTELMEGDEVTFTCTGNVGGQPAGQLVWYYYLAGSSQAQSGSEIGNVTSEEPVSAGNCSYNRTYHLHVKLKKEYNDILIRCTVQQDTYTSEGDGYIQTDSINVQCKYTAV